MARNVVACGTALHAFWPASAVDICHENVSFVGSCEFEDFTYQVASAVLAHPLRYASPVMAEEKAATHSAQKRNSVVTKEYRDRMRAYLHSDSFQPWLREHYQPSPDAGAEHDRATGANAPKRYKDGTLQELAALLIETFYDKAHSSYQPPPAPKPGTNVEDAASENASVNIPTPQVCLTARATTPD